MKVPSPIFLPPFCALSSRVLRIGLLFLIAAAITGCASTEVRIPPKGLPALTLRIPASYQADPIPGRSGWLIHTRNNAGGGYLMISITEDREGVTSVMWPTTTDILLGKPFYDYKSAHRGAPAKIDGIDGIAFFGTMHMDPYHTAGSMSPRKYDVKNILVVPVPGQILDMIVITPVNIPPRQKAIVDAVVKSINFVSDSRRR